MNTELKFLFENKDTKWHILGIGGCGMSVIARLLKTYYVNISGSDIRRSLLLNELEDENIKIYNSHLDTNVINKDVVIVSTAIPNNNIEILKAKELNIPIFHRTVILNYFIEQHEISIGIMGTHGKGTITGAISQLIYNINYAIGGILKNNNTNIRLKKPYNSIVVEIDESDGSFNNIKVNNLLINNLSYDHMDYFGSLDNLINSFYTYIINNESLDRVFINLDDNGTYKLYNMLLKSKINLITFGEKNSDYNYKITKLKAPYLKNKYSNFVINNKYELETQLLGKFNVSNLTGAISIISELNYNINEKKQLIKQYNGLKDRCDIQYHKKNLSFVKVYAHHPQEMRLVLESFKNKDNINSIAIYEPFGSEIFMKFVIDDFNNCFKNATEILIVNHKSSYTNNIYIKIDHDNKIIINDYNEIMRYLINKYQNNTSFIYFGVPNKFNNYNVLDIADRMYQYYDNNKLNYFKIKDFDKSGKKLTDLIKLNDIKIFGNKDIYISDLNFDSRNVTHNSIFFCLDGNNVNGIDYVKEAIYKGSNCIISNYSPIINNITWVITENVLKTMAELAYNFYGPYNIKLIGITGTNGKTSTCLMVKHFLEQFNKSVIYIGTLGVIYKNELFKTNNTTPNSIELNKILNKYKDVEYCVMEVTSHALELYRVSNLKFDVVALTNITGDHLDFHKTIKNYIKAKLKIFDLESRIKIINNDYFYLLDNNKKYVTFGTQGNYKYNGLKLSKNDINFKLFYNEKQINIKAPYLGKFNVENLLCAFTIINQLGFRIEDVNSFPKIPGRMEIINNKPLTIVDYSHTTDSLKKSLELCQELNSNKVAVIFGCGGDRDKSKRKDMYNVASLYSNKIIVTSDNPRTESPEKICQDISENYIVDRRKAIFYGIKNVPNDWILLIAGKGHEDYQIKGITKYKFSDKHIFKVIKNYYNKKILIAGYGKSGKSAEILLKKYTSEIDIYTDNKKLDYNKYELIVTSPGFKPNHLIYNNDINKITEFELGYEIHCDSKWIAITGSNGKTTTTSLLGMIYKYTVGNIGIPTTSLPDYIEYDETIIAEVSSAQLLINNNFKPHICVILNITPNHINFHNSFEEYKNTKLKIVEKQDDNDFVLLPYLDWAINLKCRSIKIYFGLKLDLNCCYIENNKAYLKLSGSKKEIFELKKTKLVGSHNILNILVAGTIAYLDKKTTKKIEYMIENFEPLEHRFEYVKTIKNIKFINDSKATTSYATMAALDCITDPCILIMGGISKNAKPYNIIFDYIKKKNINIKKIICYGASKNEAYNVSKKLKLNNIILCNDLKESVFKSWNIAEKNYIILLSPACSSFDQFNNYIDRGNYYKTIVDEISCNHNNI
jgi:UDP-N-acetylmuramoyl-L-alanyl-D-glutamate--2,6-diaminopimelate ligase